MNKKINDGFYKTPWFTDDICHCDRCPCCGKRKPMYIGKPWIVTCGGTNE